MQVVPHVSLQVVVEVWVHLPPHATVTLGASQLAEQAAETCILHETLPEKSKFPQGPWSSARAVSAKRSGAAAMTADANATRIWLERMGPRKQRKEEATTKTHRTFRATPRRPQNERNHDECA
jgi:hypothetical protein